MQNRKKRPQLGRALEVHPLHQQSLKGVHCTARAVSAALRNQGIGHAWLAGEAVAAAKLKSGDGLELWLSSVTGLGLFVARLGPGKGWAAGEGAWTVQFKQPHHTYPKTPLLAHGVEWYVCLGHHPRTET